MCYYQGTHNIMGTNTLLTPYTLISVLIPFRYVTRSCPLCIKADEERRANEEDLMEKFNTSNIDFVQRTEEFQHLVMIGTECKLHLVWNRTTHGMEPGNKAGQFT